MAADRRASDWASYVDRLAAVNGLELDAAMRAEVIRQMQRIDALAQRFVDFPLDPEVEPAPVFRP
jgi:hypothetical protein